MSAVDLSTLANMINALAVTAGVIFAGVQIRHYRQRRRRDDMLELVRSFQSAAFTRALRRVNTLPDGADRKTIREVLGPDGEDEVFLLGLTWESLGLLLFRREVTIDLMDDFSAEPSRSRGANSVFLSRKIVRPPGATQFGNGSSGWRSRWPNAKRVRSQCRRTSPTARGAEEPFRPMARRLSSLSRRLHPRRQNEELARGEGLA